MRSEVRNPFGDILRILVTGGAGYLGSTVSGILLEAGNRVRVLDCLLHGGHSLLALWSHPNFEFVHGDIRDADAVRRSLDGVDAVVHLAAIVGDPACARNTGLAQAINLDASLSLLKQCLKRRVTRFVFASTCSNYGRISRPDDYVDETAQLAPLSVYADSKVAFERALLSLQGAPSSFIPTSLRFATLYGTSSRMRFDLTLNEFTLKMLTAKRLTVFGEDSWRPYVHVRDAALAVSHILKIEPAKAATIFNVGATSQNFRKRDLVQLIRIHAPDAEIKYLETKGDLRNYRVSFERLTSLTGFQTTRTVQDGIAEIVRLVNSTVVGDGSEARYRN